MPLLLILLKYFHDGFIALSLKCYHKRVIVLGFLGLANWQMQQQQETLKKTGGQLFLHPDT